MKEIDNKQEWSASEYSKNASFVAEYGSSLLDILDPNPNDFILDLGCGDGVLTKKIADKGARVIGIDTSPSLLAASRVLGLEVYEMDGQAINFDRQFTAVFTNAALHWMPNAEAVLDGVSRVICPGGRFVGEFGGHGNVAAISTAIISGLKSQNIDNATQRFPWFFPSKDYYCNLLEKHGFKVEKILLTPRPTILPTGISGWLETFANPFFKGVSKEKRTAALEHAINILETSLCDEKGIWTADYVRLRFVATKSD